MWLVFIVGIVALSTCLVWLSYLNSKARGLAACLPDGSFAVDPSHFRYLSSSGFFQITFGWGNMTFTQVKAIDISWDIVSCIILSGQPLVHISTGDG